MKTEHLYRWRHRNPAGRWITTSFRCTEAEIRDEHPEAEAIADSLEIRQVPETAAERAGVILGHSTTPLHPNS